MKRNLFLIATIFLGIIATMLMGNIIVIGDKIGEITHVHVEYTFYGILLILAFIYLLRPVIKVHRAPELPVLSVDEEWNTRELNAFAKCLAANCDYISDAEKRKTHRRELLKNISFNSADAAGLQNLISSEIELRMDGDDELNVLGINGRIKEWGKTVFMVTAISQNSKFDTLAVMVMNYKMISDIVMASGFRPTKPQMFKIYVKVLTTALVTYCASQVFTDVDGVAPFDFLDGADATDVSDIDMADVDEDGSGFGQTIMANLQNLKIPGILVGSAIQGCLNALMTLRIGYVTKAYLTGGPSALNGMNNKRNVKRLAIKSSFAAMPAVIAGGGAAVGKTISNVLSGIFKNASV